MSRFLPGNNQTLNGVTSVIARRVVKGDTLTPEDPGDGGNILKMPSTGVKIVNQGLSPITLEVILILDDSTNSTKRVINAGEEDTTVGLYKGILVAGSTGHNDATTEYHLGD